VAEHVEFRPDFKKDGYAEKNGSPAVDISTVAEHPAEFRDSGTDAAGLGAADDIPTLVEELAPVTF
jgi:hypothetical protein